MKSDKFVIIIEVDEEGCKYRASGNMTAGMVKLMIGELELIKLRLLQDLEKGLK